MVAYIIETKGLANRAMHSSSMDFADEYDFANYDAWKLWDKGLNIYETKDLYKMNVESDEKIVRDEVNTMFRDMIETGQGIGTSDITCMNACVLCQWSFH